MRSGMVFLIAALFAVVFAGPATAYQDGSIQIFWGATQSINYTLTYDSFINQARTASIGPASGNWDPDPRGGTDVQSLPRIFCVDLFQFSSNAVVYDAIRYTDADGTTGWRDPVGDTDTYRDPLGLAKAAYLANTYGQAGMALSYDQSQALQVALWQAAYGTSFTYVSGLSATAATLYWNTYRPDWFAGKTASAWRWYDSNGTEGSHNQDFIEGVPEPSTLMLLGTGLLAAAGLAWKRRKRG